MLAASAPSPPSLVSAVRGGLGAPASARGSRDSPLSAERGLPSEVNALCAAPRQTLGRGPSEAKISQEEATEAAQSQSQTLCAAKPGGSDPSSEGGLRPQSVCNPLVTKDKSFDPNHDTCLTRLVWRRRVPWGLVVLARTFTLSREPEVTAAAADFSSGFRLLPR